MRTIDVIGLVSYVGIVLNLIAIAFQMFKSVRVQLRNKILLWIFVLTAWAVLSLASVVGLLFYNRFEFLAQGETTPQWISDTSVMLWLSLFLALTGISYLYYSENTKKYIPLGKGDD